MQAVEPIPDEDALHRLIDFPRMYTEARDLLWPVIFEFPNGQPESVVWSRYAQRPEDVHRLGCERESRTRERRPDMRYTGFVSSSAAVIRGIETKAGHGFAVQHEPREGAHHAEISYRPASGRVTSDLKRNEKNELKLGLRQKFGDLTAHSCS